MADLKQLAIFCHKMDNALHAGFDIKQALLLMEGENNGLLSKAIEHAYEGICDGKPLHSAMRRDEEIFTPDLVNAVYVAEQTGHYEYAFARMAKRFDAQYSTRRKIRSAMIYPIIVLIVFCIALIAVAKVWHFLPQALMILAGIAVAIMMFFFFRFSSDNLSRHSQIVGNVYIHIPFIGKCIMQEELADFASNMAIFYSCGEPVEKGLNYCLASIRYVVLREKVRKAADWVRLGNPLSEALQNQGIFPPDLINSLKTGEASGNVEEMLDRIADYYRQDIQHRTDILLAILRQ